MPHKNKEERIEYMKKWREDNPNYDKERLSNITIEQIEERNKRNRERYKKLTKKQKRANNKSKKESRTPAQIEKYKKKARESELMRLSSMTIEKREEIRKRKSKVDFARNLKAKHNPIVYFLYCDGFIKIGTTKIIKQRIKQIRQTGQYHPIYGKDKIPDNIPLTILHFIDGYKKKENEIHWLFPWIRYGASEWFKDTPELRDYIEQIQL